MLRILVIGNSADDVRTVGQEIASLLESLKVGVTLERSTIAPQLGAEHDIGVRELRGQEAVISGMVLP